MENRKSKLINQFHQLASPGDGSVSKVKQAHITSCTLPAHSHHIMDQQFVQSLENTLSMVLLPDNETIKQATHHLKTEFFNKTVSLPALIQVLQSSENEGVKKLAAVEAKKLVEKYWDELDDSIQQSIRDSILPFAFNYPKQDIRHTTSRLIADIAYNDIENEKWGNLLESLVAAATDSNKQTRETATFILYCILEQLPLAWASHSASFLELFATTLQDSESPVVQINTVLCLEALSSSIEEDETLLKTLAAPFASLLPSMLNVLKSSLNYDDTDKTKELFTAFNYMIMLDMQLLGENFLAIVHFMLETSLNTNLEAQLRGFALTNLTQCVSYRKSKIVQAQLGPQLTQAALRIAGEEDDSIEDQLSVESEENENEEDEPNALAIRLLNILAYELPPNQVVQPVLEATGSMLASQNPYERRAALLAISACVEGGPDYLSVQLPKVIQMIAAGLHDSSIIVKAAALKCLAILGETLKDAVAEYYSTLMQPIITIIDSTDKILVYKFATYALDTLIEYMASDAIKDYIEPLMNKLFHMLDTAQSSSLKSAIVSAIGSVAYASGKYFTPYFQNSIQLLEKFIANMNDIEGMTEDDIELRAQTFENISSMARAVGSEAFGPYAEPLMNASYSAIQSENSRLRESGFAFISNMAKVYGPQFASFLPKIIPEIVKCLEQDEFQLQGDEADEESLAENLNFASGIATEKEVALVALGDLAEGTKEAFAPFVDSTFTALISQITESFSVGASCISILWKITKAMYDAFGLNETTAQLIRNVREHTADLMVEEVDVNVLIVCLDSFFEYGKSLGKVAVIDEADTKSLSTLLEQITLILRNEHPCQEKDEDLPDDEDTNETDAIVYDSALEVLISLSTAINEDFPTIFAQFKDLIYSQINSKSKSKRVSTLGCLAEITNGMKTNNPYSQELLEIFVGKLTNDKSSEVRGNAAYGVGIAAEFATFDASSAYPTILQALSQLLNKADKEALKNEEGDDETAETINRTFANACGCVARLTLKHPAAVPVDAILPALFEHLPLETGFEENTPIFQLIMKLSHEENAWINANIQSVIKYFDGVFVKEAEKDKLLAESTLGREENVERLNQFADATIKANVVEYLKWLNTKTNGAVAANATLNAVVA